MVRDEQGKKYMARKGDVLIFTPVTTFNFDVESDGYAIYRVHRLLESLDNPK